MLLYFEVEYWFIKGLEEPSFIYPSAMMTYFLTQYDQKSVKTFFLLDILCDILMLDILCDRLMEYMLCVSLMFDVICDSLLGGILCDS